jgi:hypothetical protein
VNVTVALLLGLSVICGQLPRAVARAGPCGPSIHPAALYQIRSKDADDLLRERQELLVVVRNDTGMPRSVAEECGCPVVGIRGAGPCPPADAGIPSESSSVRASRDQLTIEPGDSLYACLQVDLDREVCQVQSFADSTAWALACGCPGDTIHLRNVPRVRLIDMKTAVAAAQAAQKVPTFVPKEEPPRLGMDPGAGRVWIVTLQLGDRGCTVLVDAIAGNVVKGRPEGRCW